MENLLNLDLILKNEAQLEGRLFTRLQLNILKKKLKKQPLNSNEKTYYYKFIKPRIKAMLSFLGINEINLQGRAEMLEERIPQALALIKKLEKKHKKKKIMVSGSFLFSKKFHDLDVFVFTKYNKEDYHQGQIHVNFLPEEALTSLFFSSLSQISLSNFNYTLKKDFTMDFKDFLQVYELLINFLLNKEDCQKELRDFLIKTEYLAKGVILNPKQLYNLKERISQQKDIVKLISSIFVQTLILNSKKEFLKKLKEQIEDYQELSKQYKAAKNLSIYLNTYQQVIEFAA